MDIEHLREFVTVAGLRSISRAAESLHMSQPALSAHISGLEKTFDTPLFYRERPLRLTVAGQKMLERASEVLNTYEQMQAEVKHAAHSSEVLTIGFDQITHAANMNAFAFFGRFSREFPKVHIEWVPVQEPTAAMALKNHAINCVLTNLRPLDSDIAVGLRHAQVPATVDDRLNIWMDESNPLAAKESLRWEDLKGMRIPHSERSSLLWSSGAHQLFKDHNLGAIDNLRAEDNMSFLQALTPDEVQLFDVSFVNYPVLALFPNRKLVPIDEPDAHHTAYLAYDPKQASPALELVLNILKRDIAAGEDTGL